MLSVFLMLAVWSWGLPATGNSVAPLAQEAGAAPEYRTPAKYEPSSDPDKDLAEAVAEAKRSHRNILIEVGGEWCSWCHIMDDFFRVHAELLALREKNYVLMKVNMSRENENKAFLSRYPHILVLDAEGKLIFSQETSALEDGRSYHAKRFTKFLNEFAPKT
jgi:thiol:disulfide interchange protein